MKNEAPQRGTCDQRKWHAHKKDSHWDLGPCVNFRLPPKAGCAFPAHEARHILQTYAAYCGASPADSELLRHGGIVEIAVVNQSVADYIKHWEGRTEIAERKLKEEQSGSNCNKLDRERKTKRHWQQRAEAAEKELAELKASARKRPCPRSREKSSGDSNKANRIS